MVISTVGYGDEWKKLLNCGEIKQENHFHDTYYKYTAHSTYKKDNNKRNPARRNDSRGDRHLVCVYSNDGFHWLTNSVLIFNQ